MSIRFCDFKPCEMKPYSPAMCRFPSLIGPGRRRDPRCPFGSCPASHFWIDLRRALAPWEKRGYGACEGAPLSALFQVMIRQPFFIMRDATVQLCCCVFYKAWPTDPIGSSQEQRLHATIAILGSVSSAQNVSRASWKLLEEDVATYQEHLGCYLKKMLRRIKSVLEVTWRTCCDVSRVS